MRVQVLPDDTSLLLHVWKNSPRADALLVTTSQGIPVDRFQFNFMRILEASEEELAVLRDAGYWAAGPSNGGAEKSGNAGGKCQAVIQATPWPREPG